MFTIQDRERVQGHVLELAAADKRVVAGAVVGSLADTEGDRWSDLDLTFSVSDGVPILDVLADWTRELVDELDAVQLFDLPSGTSIYRVFLLPGCLQFDLSFTPASDFGAIGPRFRLLFGKSGEKPYVGPPDAQELFGYAVHHAVRARVCIERGRLLQAEYWISGVRDYGLSLACRRRDLPARFGRGFDDLPAEVRGRFASALVTSLDRHELIRALGHAVDALWREAADLPSASGVEPQLRELKGLR
jgi:hypothetical protein